MAPRIVPFPSLADLERRPPLCSNRAVGAVAEPAWDGKRVFRALLLALLGWWTLRLAARATGWVFVDFVNLAFHEAGHVFLRPFGQTVHFLGGTIFQVGIPALLVWYFVARRGDAFASACCLWWVGENLINVSVYMADARDLMLPLVGGGEHDWNELFFRFGVLDEPSVLAISAGTRTAGVLVMLLGLAWAVTFVLPRRTHSQLVLRLAGVAPRCVRLFNG